MLHWLAILPVAASIALIASMAFTVASSVERARRAYYLAAFLIAISWLVHLYFFIVGDYSFYEVSITSGEGMSLYYRIAASWSAGGGSLLLVATIIAISSVYLSIVENLRRPGYYGALALTTLTILLASLASGAFQESKVEGGLGLNPLLKSWWVFPHPLSTFLGYGVSAAAALVLAFTTSKAGYRALLLGWSILTLGLTLGGLWSYETFGWGGYWAWDPVETAQLVVWLAVTASLHAVGPLSTSRRPLMYAVMSSVLLALYVVRSGFSPLHSFAGESLASVALLAGSLVFLAASIYVAAKDRSVQTIFRRLPLLLYDRSPAGFTLALAGVALQTALLVVYSSLIVPGVLAVLGYEAQPPSLAEGVRYYNTLLYPLFLLGLAAVPGYFISARRGWRAYQLVLASTLAASIALVTAVVAGKLTLAPKSGLTTNLMIAAALPFAAAAVGSVVAGLARQAMAGKLRYAGGSLVHGGIALAALGVLVSGAFSWSDAYAVTGEALKGEPFSLGSLSIQLKDYSYTMSSDMISPKAAAAYGYNSVAMAFLALKTLGDHMRPPEALAGDQVGSLPKPLFNGVKLGSIILEASGAVNIGGTTREGRVTLTLEDAVLYFDFVGRMPSLAGSSATLAIAYSSSSLLVSGVRLNNGLAAIVFKEPETIKVDGMDIIISSMLMSEGKAIVVDGSIRARDSVVGLPMVLHGSPLIELIKARMPDFYEKLETSGALEAAMKASSVAMLGAEALPSWVPAGSVLQYRIYDGVEEASGAIRYEANGEILGIRGLVLDVEVIRSIKGDIYLSLAPPLVDGMYNSYPEPMIFYLAKLKDRLSEEEFLAYTALLAAGYTAGGNYSEEAVPDVVDTIVDLYLLSSSWEGGEGYINVMAKAVPGVSLVWLGALIAILGSIVDAIMPVALGQGLAVREKGRQDK